MGHHCDGHHTGRHVPPPGSRTRRSRAATPGSGRWAWRRTRPCAAGRAGDVSSGSRPSAADRPRSGLVAPWTGRPCVRHSAPWPTLCGDPTPDAPQPSRSPPAGARCAQASATVPSPISRRVAWPATTAASTVPGCRRVDRTSWSTSRHRSGLPRGPRRAQSALRRLLPHAQLDRGLAQCLGQVLDLRLKLFLTRRGTRPPRRQGGPTALEELRLPPSDRLLRHLLLARSLHDGHLTGEHFGGLPTSAAQIRHRSCTRNRLARNLDGNTVNDTLKGQPDRKPHAGRTIVGVRSRITQRLLTPPQPSGKPPHR